MKKVAPVAILLAGIGGYAGLHWTKPDPEKKDQLPRALSVFVESVKGSSVDLRVSTQGEVRAGTVVDLVSQIPGRVVSVSSEFIEGGVVKSGVSLVEIESIDFQLALAQAQARLAEAEVTLQTAIATADVARKQLRDASQASDLALRKPQVAEARARMDAARAELQQAQLNLSRTQISLPFDGRLISTQVDVGQYVTPGMALGRAFATDKVEVRLPLFDSQLAALGVPIGFVAEKGFELDVTFTATVAGAKQSWAGKLVRLDAVIDRNTRTVYGIAEVQAPYTLNRSSEGMPLAVGLYVEAEILGRRIENAYVIPLEGLRAGNKVYLVNQAGKLDIREVIVTHSTAVEAVIASGLTAKERVVVSSIRNPIPGMALEALDSPAVETQVADRAPSEAAES